jgi:predicted  nucleic acid-binding Zn-ribbon protein
MTYTNITLNVLEDKIEELMNENRELKHEVEILVEALRDMQWKLDGLNK